MLRCLLQEGKRNSMTVLDLDVDSLVGMSQLLNSQSILSHILSNSYSAQARALVPAFSSPWHTSIAPGHYLCS